MNHKLGGCCDCGDDRTVIPSGSCAIHQGLNDFNG